MPIEELLHGYAADAGGGPGEDGGDDELDEPQAFEFFVYACTPPTADK